MDGGGEPNDRPVSATHNHVCSRYWRQNKFGNPSLFGTLQYASGSSVLVKRCRHRLHTPTQETIDTVIAGTVFAVAVNFILFGTTKILSVLGIYHDFLIGAPLRLIGFAILPEQKPKETFLAKACKRMLSLMHWGHLGTHACQDWIWKLAMIGPNMS